MMGRTSQTEWKARALKAESLLYESMKLHVVNYQVTTKEDHVGGLAEKLHCPDNLRAALMTSTYENVGTAQFLERHCKNEYRVERAAELIVKDHSNTELFIACAV